MQPQRPAARRARTDRPGRSARASQIPEAALRAAAAPLADAAAELDAVASAMAELGAADARLDACSEGLLALGTVVGTADGPDDGSTVPPLRAARAAARTEHVRPGAVSLLDRLVGRAAAWSLATQTWVDERVQEYRWWSALGVPPRSRTVAIVAWSLEAVAPPVRAASRRRAALAAVVRAAAVRVGAALRRVARHGAGLVVDVLSRGDVRAAVRGLATLVVAGVVAVGVLGLGRPSGIEQAGGPPAMSEPVPAPAAPAPAPAPAPVAPGDAEDEDGDLGGGSAPGPTEDAAPRPPVGPPVVPPPVRELQPVLLRAPSIGVDAPIVVVGLEDDGETMEIPDDVRTVGWYEPFTGAGVIPGESGTAVIAGHVDSRVQGRGAFWLLRDLRPGDVVDVEHADGTTTRWEVESVVRHPKDEIPIAEIFTFSGPERLALITCGGPFDRSANAYPDNYVVTAVPASASPSGPVGGLPGGRGS